LVEVQLTSPQMSLIDCLMLTVLSKWRRNALW